MLAGAGAEGPTGSQVAGAGASAVGEDSKQGTGQAGEECRVCGCRGGAARAAPPRRRQAWTGAEVSAPAAGHAGGSIVPTAVVHRPYKPATNLLEGWAA